MLPDSLWHFESIHLLGGHLFGMTAHDEMNLVRRRIDLIEQSLQINRSARPGGGNDKFHPDTELQPFGGMDNSGDEARLAPLPGK
jgi:hypothetical protein